MSKNSLSAYAIDEMFPGYDIQELIQPPLKNPRVRFRNLAVDDAAFRHKLLEAVDRVLQMGQLIMGSEVEALERRIAEYCGVAHCIGVASGTSAIYMALTAYDIGPGDEVITTPMSALGTVNAIAATGATPVFVDVGPDLNINADMIEAAVTPRTKAILPVHYTGRLCDMEKIMEVAKAHGLHVVEDASQSWGAENHLGRAGALAHAAAISISQMKILNSYGEAGVVLTDDAEIAGRVLRLRYLGMVNREVCLEPFLNHKIDTLQAAMTMVGFDRAEVSIRRRLEIARRYHVGLSDLVTCPEPPHDMSDRKCVFFDYTLSTPKRSALRLWMEEKGVEVKIRHPLTFADQPCYRNIANHDVPLASRLVHEILSLPIHEKMTDGDVDYVIESARSFFANAKA